MTRWTDFLEVGAISPNLKARDGTQVVRELAALLARGAGLAEEQVAEALLAREKLGSTAMEGGLAVPHCRLAGVERIVTCVGLHHDGLAFGEPEDGVTRIFVGLVSPPDSAGLHLRVLARIAELMRSTTLREALLQATTATEARALLVRAEETYLLATQRTTWGPGDGAPVDAVHHDKPAA